MSLNIGIVPATQEHQRKLLSWRDKESNRFYECTIKGVGEGGVRIEFDSLGFELNVAAAYELAFYLAEAVAIAEQPSIPRDLLRFPSIPSGLERSKWNSNGRTTHFHRMMHVGSKINCLTLADSDLSATNATACLKRLGVRGIKYAAELASPIYSFTLSFNVDRPSA